MPYSVIESFSKGKLSHSNCTEDRLIASGNIIGVIDGAKSVGSSKLMQELLETSYNFIRNADDQQTAKELVKELTLIFQRIKKKTDASPFRDTGGLFFAFYNAAKKEVWRLGDCQIQIGDDYHPNFLEIEKQLTDIRCTINDASSVNGASVEELIKNDPSQAVVLKFLEFQRMFSNLGDHKLGYGVINGDQVPEKFIQVYKLDKFKGNIILATDGYPKLCSTLKETEKYLADLLELDPLLIKKFKSPKGLKPKQTSFDDRSYIRFKV